MYTEGVTQDRVDPPPLESDPVIEAYQAGLDRSLLRERLKRTPAPIHVKRAGRPRDLEVIAELEALRDEAGKDERRPQAALRAACEGLTAETTVSSTCSSVTSCEDRQPG